MGKKVKKWGKSATKAVKSVGKEIKRAGSSINKEIRRHPEDYLTLGMTATAREGTKALGDLLAPDVNIDNSDPEASRLMREQQTRAENANADLSLDNVADVVSGGTAASLGGVGRKRKKGGRGPATSLGIDA